MQIIWLLKKGARALGVHLCCFSLRLIVLNRCEFIGYAHSFADLARRPIHTVTLYFNFFGLSRYYPSALALELQVNGSWFTRRGYEE